MEGPKCKLCGERHWGMCATFNSDPPILRPSVPSADGLTTESERLLSPNLGPVWSDEGQHQHRRAGTVLAELVSIDGPDDRSRDRRPGGQNGVANNNAGPEHKHHHQG